MIEDLKLLWKIKHTLGSDFNQNLQTSLSLIDSLIKPILLYASELWGCMQLPKSNPIENLYIMMCKQLLGVQKQTTNIGVLLELGRVPLYFFAIKAAIKNWERIKKGQANILLMASYNDAIMNKLPWIVGIKSVLENNAMLFFFINEYNANKPFIYNKLFQRLCDIFHQNSFASINNNDSKLRTYSIYKKEIGFEDYLSNIKNKTMRIQMTKFRLSNHRLMIEIGRHKGIEKEARFCPFCPNSIENEVHFLLTCPAYKSQRVKLLLETMNEIPGFIYLSMNSKFKELMVTSNLHVCKYVSNCTELREYLLSKHKRFS